MGYLKQWLLICYKNLNKVFTFSRQQTVSPKKAVIEKKTTKALFAFREFE
jgi:hypothetical protein